MLINIRSYWRQIGALQKKHRNIVFIIYGIFGLGLIEVLVRLSFDRDVFMANSSVITKDFLPIVVFISLYYLVCLFKEPDMSKVCNVRERIDPSHPQGVLLQALRFIFALAAIICSILVVVLPGRIDPDKMPGSGQDFFIGSWVAGPKILTFEEALFWGKVFLVRNFLVVGTVSVFAIIFILLRNHYEQARGVQNFDRREKKSFFKSSLFGRLSVGLFIVLVTLGLVAFINAYTTVQEFGDKLSTGNVRPAFDMFYHVGSLNEQEVAKFSQVVKVFRARHGDILSHDLSSTWFSLHDKKLFIIMDDRLICERGEVSCQYTLFYHNWRWWIVDFYLNEIH